MRLLQMVMLSVACVACGCVGLQSLTQPAPQPRDEEIEELVRTIDVNPDPLHSNLTPSVHKLIYIGEPALPRMLDLMLLDGSDNEFTRRHAETVIEGIIAAKHGFVPGKGWTVPDGQDRVNAFWKSMPTLDAESSLLQRRYAAMRWRAWLAKQSD